MKSDLSEVLVTGASGMLGSYVDFGIKTGRESLDVTDIKQVLGVCGKSRPKIILHLAAETDVDRCEREPSRAYLINAVGAYNVALAAKNYGAKMIYISTAGVFNGKKLEPYEVADAPNPQNHYGHSKFLGECAVKSLLDDYLILRVCWMVGGGPNMDKKFVAKIMKQLNGGSKEIRAITDQIGSPTYGKDLMRAIKILIEENKIGTFHLPNKNFASRYGVAKFVVDIVKPEVKVSAVDSSYFNLDALRPKNESLASSTDLMRPWQEAMREYLNTEWN